MQESGPLGVENVTTVPPSVTSEGLFTGISVSEEGRELTPRHSKGSDEQWPRLRKIGTILGLTAVTLGGLAGSAEQPLQTGVIELSIAAETPGYTSEQQVIEDSIRAHAAKVAATEAYQQTPAYEQQVLRKEIAERKARIEAGPSPFDPEVIASKAFVGAIIVHYNPDRSLVNQDPVLAAAEQSIDTYFSSMGLPRPEFQQNLVHRIVMGDRSQANAVSTEMLSYGVVIDPASTANGLILARHNITPVTAPVQVDGVNYTETVSAANGVQLPGDTFDIVKNADDLVGYVDVYTYEYTGYDVIDADAPIELVPETVNDHLIAMYNCGPEAGTDEQRVVIYGRQVNAVTRPGSVGDKGEVVLTHTNQ